MDIVRSVMVRVIASVRNAEVVTFYSQMEWLVIPPVPVNTTKTPPISGAKLAMPIALNALGLLTLSVLVVLLTYIQYPPPSATPNATQASIKNPQTTPALLVTSTVPPVRVLPALSALTASPLLFHSMTSTPTAMINAILTSISTPLASVKVSHYSILECHAYCTECTGPGNNECEY